MKKIMCVCMHTYLCINVNITLSYNMTSVNFIYILFIQKNYTLKTCHLDVSIRRPMHYPITCGVK